MCAAKIAELELEFVILAQTLHTNRLRIKETHDELEECIRISKELLESEQGDADFQMLLRQAPPAIELESPRSPVESPASPIADLEASHSPAHPIEIPSSPLYLTQQKAQQEDQLESPKSPIDVVQQDDSLNMADSETVQLAKHNQIQQAKSLPANVVDLESPLSPQIVNEQESPFSPINENETDIISTAMELSFIFVNCNEDKDSLSPTNDPNESPKSPEPEQENVEQENVDQENVEQENIASPIPTPVYMDYNEQTPLSPPYHYIKSPSNKSKQSTTTPKDYQFYSAYNRQCPALPENILEQDESPLSPFEQDITLDVDEPESNMLAVPQNAEIDQESPFSPIGQNENDVVDHYESEATESNTAPIMNCDDQESPFSPQNDQVESFTVDAAPLATLEVCVDQVEQESPFSPINAEDLRPPADLFEQENYAEIEFDVEVRQTICMDCRNQETSQTVPIGESFSVQYDVRVESTTVMEAALPEQEVHQNQIETSNENQPEIVLEVLQMTPFELEVMDLTTAPALQLHDVIEQEVQQNESFELEVTDLTTVPICINHEEQNSLSTNDDRIENYLEIQSFEQKIDEPEFERFSKDDQTHMDHDGQDVIEQEVQQNEPLELEESTPAPICMDHVEQDASQIERESPFSPISDDPQSPVGTSEFEQETQQLGQIEQESHAEIEPEVKKLTPVPIRTNYVDQETQTDIHIEIFLSKQSEPVEQKVHDEAEELKSTLTCMNHVEQEVPQEDQINSVTETQPFEQETRELEIESGVSLLAQPDQIESVTETQPSEQESSPKEDQVESLSTYPFEQESLESEVAKSTVAPNGMDFFEREDQIEEENQVESLPPETEPKDATLPNMDEIYADYNQAPAMPENVVEVSISPANVVEQENLANEAEMESTTVPIFDEEESMPLPEGEQNESLPFEQEASLPKQDEQISQEIQQHVESSIDVSFEQQSRESEFDSEVTVSICVEVIERESFTTTEPTLLEQQTAVSPTNAVEQETTTSSAKVKTCKRCKKNPILAKKLCSRCYLRKNQNDKKSYLEYVEKRLLEECLKAGKQKRVDPNSLNYNEKQKFKSLTAELKKEAKRNAKEKARKTRFRRKLRKLRAGGASQKRILSAIKRFNNLSKPSKRQKRLKSKTNKPKSSDKPKLKRKSTVSAASDQQARQSSSSKTPKPTASNAKPNKGRKPKKQKQPATSNSNSNLSALDNAKELEEQELIRNFKLDTPGAVYPMVGSIAKCRDCDKNLVMRSAGRCQRCMNQYYHVKRLASKQKCVRCKKVTIILALNRCQPCYSRDHAKQSGIKRRRCLPLRSTRKDAI